MHLNIRPELARRLVWEAEAVRAKFPGRFRLLLESSGWPAWVGSVPVEGRDFPIVVTYPPAYPAQLPILETPLALSLATPHLLGRSDGRVEREDKFAEVVPRDPLLPGPAVSGHESASSQSPLARTVVVRPRAVALRCDQSDERVRALA